MRKWIWRFFQKKENLWVKVIASRFGELHWGRECERREEKIRDRVGWWKKVIAVVEGREGEWFWERMEQVLGDGGRTNFWDGYWTEDKSLREMFP